MSQTTEVKVPDIGGFSDVPVIEVFVKPGDTIAVDDSICTLESDKATMDVPSAAAGTVKEVRIKTGDRVSEGIVLITVEQAAQQTARTDQPGIPAQSAQPTPAPAAAGGALQEVTVPDIGGFSDVPVIEVFIKPGDTIAVDDSICTLESDKATMDVPSNVAGTVEDVLVTVGDRVSEGKVLIRVSGQSATAAQAAQKAPAAVASSATAAPPVTTTAPQSTMPATTSAAAPAASAITLGGKVHASPSVRAIARELGVDLAKVAPTGPKNRILKEDVVAFVKKILTSPAGQGSGGAGLDLLPWPSVDFSKFGEIDIQPLARIKKISGANLARNWVMIPAVTYHEDADITDLENFRKQINAENEKSGRKLTMLAFLVKASVMALKKFPEFNSSLDGENLIHKKYYHIGFAADTPNGLVVPVIKNVDQKSVLDIAQESAELAKKARDGKLGPADMSGACFTISSLGGIGGTYFSPIINAPEVAILGVNKNIMKPVWNGSDFIPRLILPLSLTADHRVIDGALATRFNVYLAELLADFRRAML